PVLNASRVWLRYSPLPRRGAFEPTTWFHHLMTDTYDGWRQIDITALSLSDGPYEYEFVVDRPDGTSFVAADPYAEDITRFCGYRGVFHVLSGQRVRLPFSWANETPAGLPQNNQVAIYELPMRWI